MKKLKIVLTTILLVTSTWLANAQGFKSLMIPCTVKAPVCDTTPLNNCEYICNGGFETYSTTIWAPSQLPWANGWTSPTWGTPDLFCKTSTVAAVQIPCNGLGYQASRTGTNSQVYAGIYTSGDGGNPYAEYLQTQLKWYLNAGDLYEVSFWVSRADFQPVDNDRLDVFITSSVNCINGGTGNPGSFDYANTNTANIAPNPSYNVPLSKLNDATNWQEVKFVYCANGNETHFIIGSYTGTSTTNVTPTTSVGSCSLTTASTDPNSQYYSYGPAYLYVDDVSMKRITSTVAFSPNNRCVGTPVGFTITPISCFSPPSNYYIWNYGDGTLPAAGNLTSTHSYTAAGVYTVTVSYNIPSAIGCTPTHTMLVTVANCCYNSNANNITLHNTNLVANGTSGATTWTAMTTGNTYTGNIAVPSGTIVTNTLTVIGSMTISTPVTFSLCNIAINQDAPIYQNSYTKFDRCWLYGCNYMWEGVVSTSTLEVYNSFIEDAYQGIKAGNGSTYGGLFCDNVVFDKNYNSIVASSGSVSPSNFNITGCIFTSRTISSAMHDFSYPSPRYTTSIAPLSARVPAKLKGSTTHSITNNTIRSNIGVTFVGFLSTTTLNISMGETSGTPTIQSNNTNYFDYINGGIYNVWSKIFVKNNSFSNMINTGVGNAIGAVVHDDPNLFGIDKITKTKVGDVTGGVYKNVFTVIKDGVVATNSGTLEVSGNDFNNVNRYGVSVSTWYSSASPIELVTVSANSYTDCLYPFYAYDNNYIKATVNTNTVTHVASTYTSGYCTYVNELSKPANATYSITNNKYSGMLNGISFINTSGARIVGNTITIKKPGTGVFNAGITLSNTDNTIVSDNTIDCNPTNSASWYTFGLLGAASAGNTVQCNTFTKVGSCLKFQSAGSPTYIHDNSFNNNSSDPCLFGVLLDNSANIGSIGLYESSTWKRSKDLWGDFLYGSPNFGADTYVQGGGTGGTIYYDAAATPTANYTPIVNTANTSTVIISTAFSPSNNTNANGFNCGIGARFAAPTAPKSIGKNGGSDLETVNKKRIILRNGSATNREIANENNFSVVDSLLMDYIATKNQSSLNSAKSINSGINASGNIEQNQKDFNSIYAVYLEADSLVSANQIQDLVTMSKLCPFIDGLAVYQARAMMRRWDDSTFFYNDCEINVPSSEEHARNVAKSLEQSPSSVIADLYPNPANNSILVKTNLNNSILEVYDVIGKHIFTQKLIENETKIDVTSFNNGTYLYKITDSSNKVIKNGKLIINH